MTLVTIVIPTYRRPEMLVAAIESCLAQRSVEPASCEVLVVDNSPEGSARALVEQRFQQSGLPVRYRHEPKPGIASARNAGVAAASGRFIAFLDDDEVATPQWLSALLAHGVAGAQAVFGPVEPRFEALAVPVSAGAARMFRRALPAADGEDISRFNAHLGSGNSLFEKAICFPTGAPFCSELDGLGGEDSDLIFGLVRRGIGLIWAADALVFEHVPASRMSSPYLAQRSLRNGQIRSLVRFRARGLQSLAGVGWMAAGFAQVATFGSVALALAALRPRLAAEYRLRAISGIGKILWMRPFWPRTYPSSNSEPT